MDQDTKRQFRALYEDAKAFVRKKLPPWAPSDDATIDILAVRLMVAELRAAAEKPETPGHGDVSLERLREAAFELAHMAEEPGPQVPNDFDLQWPVVWHGWCDENAATLAARSFLANEKDRELATLPEAEGRLVDALRRPLDQTRQAIPLQRGAELERLTDDGELAVVVQHVAILSRSFPKLAKTLRAAERERLNAWRADPTKEPPWERWADRVFFGGILAQRLWKGDVSEPLPRLRHLPAPTISPLPRKLIQALATGDSLALEANSIIITRGEKRLDSLPCPMVTVDALNQGGIFASIEQDALVPVAAYLAREFHRRWTSPNRDDRDRPDYVPMRMGRDAILTELGIRLTEDEITKALATLKTIHADGAPCVVAYWEEEEDPPRNGRPIKRRVVHVGSPLAPYGLADVFKKAGVTPPKGLRFFSPVLRSNWAPLKGDQRTAASQRNFFAFGLGALLIEHREEYANGGVRFDERRWRQSAVEMGGLYHRTHHSLADQVWQAVTSPPKQLSLDVSDDKHLAWPKHPVLVPDRPGGWVLGPDFEAEDRAIRMAAKASQDARKRRKGSGT